MDYIFYQVAAINGFDAFGHYLRAGLIVNTCSTYSIQPIPGCSANFRAASSSTASAAAAQPRDQGLLRTAQALREALATTKKQKAKSTDRVRRAPLTRPATRQPLVPAPKRSPDNGAGDPLLDYLFGGDR
jgi:hypothetical protein